MLMLHEIGIYVLLKEKLVLESPDGMLTDRHMDAVNRLLRSQFPHFQGLQSSLISQSRNGFNPVEVSGECVPKGMIVETNHTPTNRPIIVTAINFSLQLCR